MTSLGRSARAALVAVLAASALSSVSAGAADQYPRFDPSAPLYEISGAPPAPLHIVLQTLGTVQDPTVFYGTDPTVNPPVAMTDAGTDFGGGEDYTADVTPAAPAVGCDSVKITATWSTAQAGQQQVTGSVTVLCPALTADPAGPLSPDTDRVRVVPQHFDVPGVRAAMLTVDGVPVPGGTSWATAAGSGSIGVAVPRSCGTHPVSLQETIPAGLLQATAPLTVQCPTATVTPGQLANSPGATVTVTATGFPTDDGPVDVQLDGTTVTTAPVASDGSVDVDLPVGSAACADHTVTLASVPRDWVRASAGFSLACSAAGPLAVHVLPGAVARGGSVLIVVDNVPDGARLTMSWSLPDGRLLPVNGSDAAVRLGPAVAQYSWIVDDLTGQRTLQVSDGADAADAALVVTGGTLQPAGAGRMSGRR